MSNFSPLRSTCRAISISNAHFGLRRTAKRQSEQHPNRVQHHESAFVCHTIQTLRCLAFQHTVSLIVQRPPLFPSALRCLWRYLYATGMAVLHESGG